jgi:hypothetical protein
MTISDAIRTVRDEEQEMRVMKRRLWERFQMTMLRFDPKECSPDEFVTMFISPLTRAAVRGMITEDQIFDFMLENGRV